MPYRISLILVLILSTGCTALQPADAPISADAQRQAVACQEPPFLVRDLTVPWPKRTYLIGPCEPPSTRHARC